MMSILTKLLLLYALAALCELAAAIWYPQHTFAATFPIASLIGSALAIFIGGGIFPLVLWALVRFRLKAADGPMLLWALLIVAFAYFQHYEYAHHG